MKLLITLHVLYLYTFKGLQKVTFISLKKKKNCNRYSTFFWEIVIGIQRLPKKKPVTGIQLLPKKKKKEIVTGIQRFFEKVVGIQLV